MQHHKELESESSQEEDWYPEEDTICDLQCGDSLAIAANCRGEEVFGVKVKKHPLRTFGGLRRGQRS